MCVYHTSLLCSLISGTNLHSTFYILHSDPAWPQDFPEEKIRKETEGGIHSIQAKYIHCTVLIKLKYDTFIQTEQNLLNLFAP